MKRQERQCRTLHSASGKALWSKSEGSSRTCDTEMRALVPRVMKMNKPAVFYNTIQSIKLMMGVSEDSRAQMAGELSLSTPRLPLVVSLNRSPMRLSSPHFL